MCAWPSPPRRGPNGASRSEGPGSASTPVPPRPIPPAGRGDPPPGVARCRARHAARRCRGLEARARADDQVTHGARHEDFPAPAWPTIRAAMCTAIPPMSAAQQFALAGVNASADLDTQCLGVSTQGLGAADGLRRAVKRDEVAVAGALRPPCRRRRARQARPRKPDTPG